MSPEYIDHLMGCDKCFAPARRYCERGQNLKIQSDAEYVIGLPALKDRRLAMESMKRGNPELYVRLEEKVKALFAERQSEADR